MCVPLGKKRAVPVSNERNKGTVENFFDDSRMLSGGRGAGAGNMWALGVGTGTELVGD